MPATIVLGAGEPARFLKAFSALEPRRTYTFIGERSARTSLWCPRTYTFAGVLVAGDSDAADEATTGAGEATEASAFRMEAILAFLRNK